MAAVAIRCVRPCLHEGRALFAGEVVNVAPLVASDLLASGRSCSPIRPTRRASTLPLLSAATRWCARSTHKSGTRGPRAGCAG